MKKVLNKEKIARLASGEVSILFTKGDDGLEELREIIKEAFPMSYDVPLGSGGYYRKLGFYNWIANNSSNELEVLTVDDFYEKSLPVEPNGFKLGETILVSDSEEIEFVERIFLAYVGGKYPYIIVPKDCEEEFKIGDGYVSGKYRLAKPKPSKTRLTEQQIADKFGIDVNYLIIE